MIIYVSCSLIWSCYCFFFLVCNRVIVNIYACFIFFTSVIFYVYAYDQNFYANEKN